MLKRVRPELSCMGQLVKQGLCLNSRAYFAAKAVVAIAFDERIEKQSGVIGNREPTEPCTKNALNAGANTWGPTRHGNTP